MSEEVNALNSKRMSTWYSDARIEGCFQIYRTLWKMIALPCKITRTTLSSQPSQSGCRWWVTQRWRSAHSCGGAVWLPGNPDPPCAGCAMASHSSPRYRTWAPARFTHSPLFLTRHPLALSQYSSVHTSETRCVVYPAPCTELRVKSHTVECSS